MGTVQPCCYFLSDPGEDGAFNPKNRLCLNFWVNSNLKGHPDSITGSRVMASLPVGGASAVEGL